MSVARDAFVAMARAQLGKPVLWNKDGPDVFDCSGLAAFCLKAIQGPDLRATHNAQRMHDETPNVLTHRNKTGMLDGDLVFYGYDAQHVIHVAIWVDNGKVISADGATPRIGTLEKAISVGAKVRLHDTVQYRRAQYISLHRNVYVDALDGISR